MGGGTILVLALSQWLQVEQHVAQATNLIYFVPTSLAAIWVYWKQGQVEKKLLWKMVPLGMVGGVVGSYLATILPATQLKRYFGIFLLVIGVYEILTTVKNKGKEKQNVQRRKEFEP